MSLAYSGVEPQPALAWQFENSNVDSVTSLAPSSQVSPGPAQLQGSAALVTNAPTSNTAVYLPSSVNSYMNMPVDIIPASANLFVEAWFYNITTTSQSYIMVRNNSTQNLDNSEDWGFRITGTTLQLYNWFSDGTVNVLSSTTSVPVSTWTHIAFIFDITNKNYTIFVNGIASGTANFTGKTLRNTSTNMATFIGTKYLHTAWSSINAYICDLRVVQGGVVPTASFTPGAAPFSYALPSYVTGSGSVVFTLLGQFVTYVPGKYGQGIYFVNNNAIGYGSPRIANCYSIYTISQFKLSANNSTVSVWMNPYYSPTFGGNIYNFSIADAVNDIEHINNPSGNPGPSSIGNYNTPIIKGADIVTGQWMHASLVFSNVGASSSNSTVTYYLNGVSQGFSNINASTSVFSTISLGGGTFGGNGNHPSWLSLDDLRIYNTALTATQVASVYSSQGAPAPSLAMPLPTYAWSFESSNVDYVSSLSPASSLTGYSYTSGKYGQAISFTQAGDLYPNAQDATYTISPSISTSTGFSIFGWIKPGSIAGVPIGIRGPVSYYDMYMSNYGIYAQFNPNGAGVAYPLVVNTWYHVGYTMVSKVMTLYLNGVVVATSAYTSEDTIYSLVIGRCMQYNGHAYNGTIDDLRVYNTALTSTQVQSIYNQQGVPGRGVVNGITPNITQTPVATIYGNQITPADTSTSKPTTSVSGQTTYSNTSSQYTQFGSGLALTPATTGLTISIVLTFNNGVFTTENLFYFGGNGNYQISVRLANYDALAFQFWDSIASRFISYNPPFTPIASWSAGVKYYFTFTITPVSTTTVNYSVYVNGAVNGSGSGTSTATALNNGTYTITTIGANNNGAYANMTVYDFFVLNTVLSDSQVSTLYQKQLANSNYQIAPPAALTGTPLFSQLSPAATSSAVGAFSLRAVNGVSVKAVAVIKGTLDYSSPPLTVAFTGSVARSSVVSNVTEASMYFPGSGNYLKITDSRFTRAWTTGMTFEAWVNYPSFTYDFLYGNNPTSFGVMDPTGGNNSWSFGPNLTGYLVFYYYNGSTISVSASTTPLSLNTWYHIAVQTNGTTIYLYVNGVLVGQAAISGTPFTPENFFTIGQYGNAGPTFYVGDVRLVYGANPYSTSGFTPPSAPLAPYTTGGATTALLLRTPSLSQDFYADRLGNLLTAPVVGQSLANWLGGATGYVTTWYDQSGKGNHATQATAANQPVIQRATKGAGYSCLFNGTTNYFGTSFNLIGTPFLICVSTLRNTSAVNLTYVGTNGTSGLGNFLQTGYYNPSTQVAMAVGTGAVITVPAYSVGSEPMAYDFLEMFATAGSGVGIEMWGVRNGTQVNGGNNGITQLLSASSGNVLIGAMNAGSGITNYFSGEMYEILIFNQTITPYSTQIYQNQLSAYGT